jgi:hypothetical protein
LTYLVSIIILKYEKNIMNFDQPNATKDDVAKKILEAKGAQEKLPATPTPNGGSLDDFLAEIKPVDAVPASVKSAEAVVPATEMEAKKEGQQEKNRQAKEKIKPLIDKFNKLSSERKSKTDYVRGQKEYAVLKGDKEEYRKLHSEDINGWLAEADIYEKALKEYKEAGGEGDLQSEMYTGSTRESVLIFEKSSMGGADEMFEKSQAGLAGKYDKSGDYKSPNEVRSTTPDDYISKLASNAVAEAGRKAQWGNNPEMRKNDLRTYFEKKSQGFGIEALNHGDVAVAARSLALAEAVGEIPADLQEQMRVSYKKLDETKKTEFGTALVKERKEIKQKLEQALAQNK